MSKIEFLLDAIELKDTPRKGWVLRGVEDPEDVGSHSWGVGLLASVYVAETELNESKVLKMAIVHDVAESRIGDTAIGEVYQEVSNSEKLNDERAAWGAFEEMADVSEFRKLWEEMEAKANPEAKFVADMDVLDMCLTALKYERQNRYNSANATEDYENLDGFFETANKNIQTDIGRQVYKEIYKKYRKAKQNSDKD